MVTPAAGSVVLVPFPFSDLSQSKLRPAVVLADAGLGDWILCQVTSRSYADPRAVQLTDQDFEHGSLHVVSYARPAKLFTAHQSLFVAEAGSLKPTALESIINGIVSLLHNTT
jgi:mRNA interferase MazF